MKSFRLVSYNICSAHFEAGHYTENNLLHLADTIKDESFDAVCLQEVDRGAARSEGVDMTARLAELAGYSYTYFIKIRDFSFPCYRNISSHCFYTYQPFLRSSPVSGT